MTTFFAWVLTYLIHSTLLCGLAWLASLLLVQRPRVVEAIGRAALLGGLVTASLQVGLGTVPKEARIALGAEDPIGLEAQVMELAGAAQVASLRVEVEPPRRSGPRPVRSPRATLVDPTEITPVLMTAPPAIPGEPAWLKPASLAVLITLALGGLAGLVAWLRVRQRLARRRDVDDPKVLAVFDELLDKAGMRPRVRLSWSPRIDSPVAFGVTRPEICLPARTPSLDRDLQEGLLAHELAHIVRRDPAWRLLVGVLSRVLWFQPLNRLLERRLEASSELLCDEWAVSRTRRPLALAECLAAVADWIRGGAPAPLLASMARSRSGLGRRIDRLLAAAPPSRGLPRLGLAGLLATLGGLVVAAPGASIARPDPPEPPAAPDAPVLPDVAEPPAPPAPPARRFAKAARPPAPPRAPAAPRAPRAPMPAMPAMPAVPAVPVLPAPVVMPEQQACNHDHDDDERDDEADGLEDQLEREVERTVEQAAKRLDQREIEALVRQAQSLALQHRLDTRQMQELERRAARLAARLQLGQAEINRLTQMARNLARQARTHEGEMVARALRDARRELEEAREQLRGSARQAAHEAMREAKEARQTEEEARKVAEQASQAEEEEEGEEPEVAEDDEDDDDDGRAAIRRLIEKARRSGRRTITIEELEQSL